MGGAGNLLTVTQPVTTVNGRISLVFDDMTINNSVTGGSFGLFGPDIEGQVNLAPATAGRVIDVGTNTAGDLGLTDAGLDHVTAPVALRIGAFQMSNATVSTTGGNITVSAAITQAGSGYTPLDLLSTGSITGAGSLTGTSLALQAATGIGPLNTAETNLAFTN